MLVPVCGYLPGVSPLQLLLQEEAGILQMLYCIFQLGVDSSEAVGHLKVC